MSRPRRFIRVIRGARQSRVVLTRLCQKCLGRFFEGDEYVLGGSGGHGGKGTYFHRRCYTDAHGEPIL